MPGPEQALVKAATLQRGLGPTQEMIAKAIMGVTDMMNPGDLTDPLTWGTAMAPIPPGLGKLLAKWKGITKPGMTATQATLRDFAEGVVPAQVQKAFAAHEAFKPLTQPHNRREFFKNAAGLPHRARQVEATNMGLDLENATAESGGMDPWDLMSPEEAARVRGVLTGGDSPLDWEPDFDNYGLAEHEAELNMVYDKLKAFAKTYTPEQEIQQATEEPISNIAKAILGRFGRGRR